VYSNKKDIFELVSVEQDLPDLFKKSERLASGRGFCFLGCAAKGPLLDASAWLPLPR
jgi:hypothetical protein